MQLNPVLHPPKVMAKKYKELKTDLFFSLPHVIQTSHMTNVFTLKLMTMNTLAARGLKYVLFKKLQQTV